MHPVHAEAAGPKLGGSDGPVVLHVAVLGGRRIDEAVVEIPVSGYSRPSNRTVTPAVAAANAVLRVDSMIQFDVELITGVTIHDHLAEVGSWKNCTRHIGMRIEIQNRLPDFVNLVCRYLVQHPAIRKLRSRTRLISRVCQRALCRIKDSPRVGCQTLRKVACALQIGGNNPFDVLWIVLTSLFKVKEEEGPFFDDRASHRETILITKMIGFGP